jgi:hypothetical protein
MALISITILDTHEGPSFAVLSEPPLPQTILDGRPTPAQNAAALMLNAVQSAVEGEGPRIHIPQGH